MTTEVALLTLAAVLLSAPMIARAIPGADLNLQPKPWKRATTFSSDVPPNNIVYLTGARRLVGPFEASKQARQAGAPQSSVGLNSARRSRDRRAAFFPAPNSN